MMYSNVVYFTELIDLRVGPSEKYQIPLLGVTLHNLFLIFLQGYKACGVAESLRIVASYREPYSFAFDLNMSDG
jgi:hypothetical protein